MLHPMLQLAAWLLFPRAASAVTLWPSAEAIPADVPPACRQALARNLTCDDDLVTAAHAMGGRTLPDELAARYCTLECHDSLQEFRIHVDRHCGNAPYRMFHDSAWEQSGAMLAGGLLWAYELSCLRDSSGFCLVDLYAGGKGACSECSLEYGVVMAGSDYGQGAVSPDALSSLLYSCSADPTRHPYMSSPLATASTAAAYSTLTTVTAPSATCSGTKYVVQAGDSCESISSAAGVATDRMIDLNHLDYNCTTLTPGMALCLQDQCAVHAVTSNDTCSSITRGTGFSKIQLTSWNPTIHFDCGNLDAMVGRSICLSPPGKAAFDVGTKPSKHNRPTLTSPMFSSWIPTTAAATYSAFATSWYTPTVDLEVTPLTMTNSYNATRASLIAQRSKYCWIESDAWAEGLSPQDLPSDCQSLVDTYCFPRPEALVPTSPAHIPAVCTPAAAVSYRLPFPANPTPTQPIDLDHLPSD
ncbi:lysM domain-containing protein [Hirsutella rhossiliensis]|uniref:LysM domain-containing protein n=1 Tax=Hirsutella rhossiliensis TaxID=111463 RepID=A0A9P8N9J1_9HYPO|nr:lysM domain-containing protein [Hirsutella rhossiliensis]KAH0968486.1 lysM domain-containing protein [Hirsutella rhossiliensis]